MPTFQYQTLAGGTGVRTVEAPDRASAIRLLAGRGETPTRLDPLEESKTGAAGQRGGLFKRVMSRSELASFMRELATATQAGLPLVSALRTIQRSGRSESQRTMLTTVISEVEHGTSLSDALERVGRPFDDLVVSLVNAGELAGRLGEVLHQAATLLDREVKLKRALVGAMTYPLIILALVVIAVIVVVTVIVPRVLASVAGQLDPSQLPLPTQIVKVVADFFGSWWWLVLGAIAVGVFAWTRLYAQPEFRLKVDRFVLRIPVVGVLVREVAVARFTRTLGTLVGAGLPVLASLKITRATLGNKALEEAIEGVADQVSEGKTIGEPMEQSGYFPPLLVQIVGMGERTGKLDTMLLQAADAFEERTEQAIKLFTTVLPPLLICVLAVLVGFVLLAILLPLLELQESIGV
jgi:type II secretory pathway component PulF